MSGCSKTIESILSESLENHNPKDKKDWTPLHEAAYKGHQKIVKLLLEHENVQNVHSKNKNGYAPIHEAAREGHDKTIQFFLKNDTKVAEKNPEDIYGETVMHHACKKGHDLVVKAYLRT